MPRANEMAREMGRAIAEGECYITNDGWCATHSTGEGPVYCEPAEARTPKPFPLRAS